MGRLRKGHPLVKALVGAVFFGAFTLAGAFGAYKLAVELPRALKSPGWPTVEGTVTRSELVSKRKNRKKHRLRYVYQVAERTYEGDQVTFLGRVFSASARDRYRQYPSGRAVQVYYDPDEPAISILQPGVHWATFGAVGTISSIFLAFGLWGLRVSFRG